MTATGLLDGVRVVSLAQNLPGPIAAARLAELGAQVTKVEPPGGDQMGLLSPGWYAELAAGQQVVGIDLKDPAGREELERLLDGADILITAMRPSALERLGLPASVERHRLVHVEIVGYAGERADEAGHDLTYQAAYGTVPASGLPAVPVVDLLGGERAVGLALAGLRTRALDGLPRRLPVVLDEIARGAGAGIRHRVTTADGILGGALPGYAVYEASDGRVAVAALEPHFARRLESSVGRTREELAAAFADGTAEHWESLGQGLDIPIVAVHDA